MAERVCADLLTEVNLVGDRLHGILDSFLAHGILSHTYSAFLQRVVPAIGGEEPSFVLMCLPVLAKHMQSRRGDRHVSIFRSFAAMDVDQSTSGVDVADLQMKSFVEPEPQGVDGPEEGLHPEGCGGIDDGMNLVDGQHFGERVNVLQLEHGEDLPVPFASDGVEELDAGKGDSKGAVGEQVIVLEVQEELSDLGLSDQVGLFSREVRQLSDSAKVAIMGACRFTSQVEIIAHLLVKFLTEELGGGLRGVFSVRLSHVRNL